MRRLAIIIEPTDKVLGMEATMPKANAFYNGGLIGARIVERCVPTKVRSTIMEANFGVPELTRMTHAQVQEAGDRYAGEVIAQSDRGLNDTEDVAELLGKWEPRYTPDLTVQHFFSRGAGLLLDAMQQSQELVIRGQMEQAVEQPDGINWDQALFDLLGGGQGR